ncbi:hypothetical protein PHISP_05228 [Aspergillus sp. HF37]|nr:hypothetical protein PHISP_05228 [Aspergillus sp. HF37]
MGSYTFRWPYNANEVFVTGTFDDWGKTVKLDRRGDVFEKDVRLPAMDRKIHYKVRVPLICLPETLGWPIWDCWNFYDLSPAFAPADFVVDGIWSTDNTGREENDGNNNINNVLFPEDIQEQSALEPASNHTAVMSGVTPGSTTAALAAQVPKEGGDPTISSAAPDSTSAELTKQSLQERSGNVPGSFPQTPLGDSEEFSVNPIPASSGIGNPTQLRPGDKVPDPSAVNENTVGSTVRTDKDAYEADASAHLQGGSKPQRDIDLTLPTESKNLIPESSLPMGESNQPDPGYTINSVGPASTTAALAAGVPKESEKQQTNGEDPVGEVPGRVKDSMAEAHEPPEAAASHEVVGEKADLEKELQGKVNANEYGGAPPPTMTAATTETAPRPTGQPDSAQLSPRSSTPTQPQPTVTTGVGEAKAPPVSEPRNNQAPPEPRNDPAPTGATVTTRPTPAKVVNTGGSGSAFGDTQQRAQSQGNVNGAESESKTKRKSRTSEFFSKLKERFR